MTKQIVKQKGVTPLQQKIDQITELIYLAKDITLPPNIFSDEIIDLHIKLRSEGDKIVQDLEKILKHTEKVIELDKYHKILKSLL
jgi:hypothetical protein